MATFTGCQLRLSTSAGRCSIFATIKSSVSKGVSDGSRTATFWFTARRAETATPQTPYSCQHPDQDLNPERLVRTRHDFHFTIGANSGRQGSRTLIPCFGNRFSKAARPTVSGYLPFDLVDPPGIEPESPACRTGVFPLDDEPVVSVDRRESNPIPACGAGVVPLDQQPMLSVDRWVEPIQTCKVSRLRTCGPSLREVRPGIEPGLPPYHGGVLPKHLQTKVIPDGIEPSFPGRQPGVVAVGPRDRRSSSRGGSRTHKVTRLSTSPLCQVCVPGHVQVAGPGVAPGGRSL